MIGSVGAGYLLGLQMTALATATWRLLVGAVPDDDETVWADLTEAGWAGYAAQVAGAWSTPYLNGAYMRMDPQTTPGFGNSSGADQSPTGWALVASDGVTLVAWDAFANQVVIPDGLTAYLQLGLALRGL